LCDLRCAFQERSIISPFVYSLAGLGCLIVTFDFTILVSTMCERTYPYTALVDLVDNKETLTVATA